MRVDLNNQQTTFKGYKLGRNIKLLRKQQTIEAIDAYIKEATEKQSNLCESDMDIIFDGTLCKNKTYLVIDTISRLKKGLIERLLFGRERATIEENIKEGITKQGITDKINNNRRSLGLPVETEIKIEQMQQLKETVKKANQTERENEQITRQVQQEDRTTINKAFSGNPGEDD